MALNTMLNTNTNVPPWAGDALGVGPHHVGAATPPAWATDPGWPQRNRLRKDSKKSPSQTLKEAYASTRLGQIYKAPSTKLAPIVSAPPSPTPAPVATPVSWLPPAGAGGAGGGGVPMGGGTVSTGGGEGSGLPGVMDALGMGLSAARLASKLAPAAYDPFGSQALWAASEEALPSVASSFARNPFNFMEAYTGGHLEAAFELGGPAAQRAAFIASEFGAPGNVPSMLELTEISGGLGDAFLPSIEGIPQYGGADIASFYDLPGVNVPSTASIPPGADYLGPLPGTGPNLPVDPWGMTPSNASPGSGSDFLDGGSGSDFFIDPVSYAAYPSGATMLTTPMAGIGGSVMPAGSMVTPLSGAGIGDLGLAASMPVSEGALSGAFGGAAPIGPGGAAGGAAAFNPLAYAGPAMFAAAGIPIAMEFGKGMLQTLGLIDDPRDAERAHRLAQLEYGAGPDGMGGINRLVRAERAGELTPELIDEVTGSIFPGTLNPADQAALERLRTGSADAPGRYSDSTGTHAGGYVPLTETQFMNSLANKNLQGVSEIREAIKRQDIDREQLPVANRVMETLIANAGITGGIPEYDAMHARWQQMSQGLSQGGQATDYARQELAKAYLADPPEGGINETRQLADLFGSSNLHQTLGLDRMQAMQNPYGAPPSVPITSVYQPTPQAAAPTSMLNLQSFTDIPGMAGRSSGDLTGINPGFTDPAVQQAYTGFTGNVPGAGRTLLDLFNANPTAYSRFQQALV